MPDIFIPVDTLYYSPYYNKVWDGNVLYRYTLDFSDRPRKELDRVTTIEQLDSLLDGCNLLEEFIAYAERNGIPRNDADIAKSKEVIKAQIRPILAVIVWVTTLASTIIYIQWMMPCNAL